MNTQNLAHLKSQLLNFISRCPALALGVCLAAPFLACSVQRATVTNEPPVFEDALVKFSTEYGVMKPAPGEASLFFAPPDMTESQAQAYYRKIQTLSVEVDLTATEFYRASLALQSSAANFAQVVETEACFSADIAKTQKNLDVLELTGKVSQQITVVGEWITLDQPTDERAPEGSAPEESANEESPSVESPSEESLALKKRLTSCMASQEQLETALMSRFKVMQILGGLAAATQKAVATGGGELSRIAVSSLSIQPGNPQPVVTIELAALMGSTQPQRTGALNTDGSRDPVSITNAFYFPSRKLLTFEAPVLAADGSATGEVIVFMLERAPDFLGKARFSGDANLMKNGVVLRHGSAKFESLLQ